MNKKKMECDECHEFTDELMVLEAVDGSVERLCESCHESAIDADSPKATVIYDDDDEDDFKQISHYQDETDGDFKVTWHSTDGWRGYYDVTPSEKWAEAHGDCVLSGSGDADDLETFDEKLREALRKLNIRYARVYSTTSNVFSQGYDFFVEKGREMEAKKIIAMLELQYRDPMKFRTTALTGKDPKDVNEFDMKLVRSTQLLEFGIPVDAVLEIVGFEKNVEHELKEHKKSKYLDDKKKAETY